MSSSPSTSRSSRTCSSRRSAPRAPCSRSSPFPPKLTAEEMHQTIVGNSPAMQQVYKLIGQVAPTSTTILITGESGTGKELVARAIYQNSARAEQGLHRHQLRRHSGEPARERALRPRKGRVHRRACAAHRQVRAVRRRHAFPRRNRRHAADHADQNPARAAGGRDFARRQQPVDQDRRAHHRRHEQGPVAGGAAQGIPRGPFLPAQRRAPEPAAAARARDRRAAARRLLHQQVPPKQPTGPSQIADDAMAAIQRYPWPGNVRELENCIQRAMVLASGNTITLANLPEEIARGSRSGTAPRPSPVGRAGRRRLRFPARRGAALLQPANRTRPRSPARSRRFSNSRARTSSSNSCPPPNANSSSAPWPRPAATRSRPPSSSASPAPPCASGSTNSASKSGWPSTDLPPVAAVHDRRIHRRNAPPPCGRMKNAFPDRRETGDLPSVTCVRNRVCARPSPGGRRLPAACARSASAQRFADPSG